jgi:hypothetical protein
MPITAIAEEWQMMRRTVDHMAPHFGSLGPEHSPQALVGRLLPSGGQLSSTSITGLRATAQIPDGLCKVTLRLSRHSVNVPARAGAKWGQSRFLRRTFVVAAIPGA